MDVNRSDQTLLPKRLSHNLPAALSLFVTHHQVGGPPECSQWEPGSPIFLMPEISIRHEVDATSFASTIFGYSSVGLRKRLPPLLPLAIIHFTPRQLKFHPNELLLTM